MRSSDATRVTFRIVSQRSRNESAGGRFRRTSCSGRTGTRSGRVPGPSPSDSVRAFGTRGWNGSYAGKLRSPEEGTMSGLLDRPLEAIAQRALLAPAQQLLRERRVGLADLRVVGGERLEDDLGFRADHLDHRFGELEQCELVGIADVHRFVVP